MIAIVLASFALVLILVPMTGARLAQLSEVSLSHEVAIVMLFLVQAAIRGYLGDRSPLGPWVIVLWGVSGLVMLGLLWPSRFRPGIALLMLGVYSNLIVVLANGWMPVAAQDVGTSAFYRSVSSGDALSLLGDVLPAGRYAMVSIGDLLLSVGLLVFVIAAASDSQSKPGTSSAPSLVTTGRGGL